MYSEPMPLETQVGKAVIQIDYMTHAGPERALEFFNKWIRTSSQWQLGITVLVEPDFKPAPKEDQNEEREDQDYG